MSSKLMQPNPYFVDRTPEQYAQLAIALSYATEKLNEKIRQEKIMNYKTIKSQITDQLIKREALKQIAEMDSFILKKDLNNLFNQQIADNQVVSDGLNDIYGTTGFSSSAIGEETKDEIDTTPGAIDDTGASEDKSEMQLRIDKIDQLTADDIDRIFKDIKNLSFDELMETRTGLINIEESGLQLSNNVKFFINEYFEKLAEALTAKMNEDEENAPVEEQKGEPDLPDSELTTAKETPIKERPNIKFTDKEQKYLKDKPAKLVKSKTQDELKMIFSDLSDMEQRVRKSKTPGRTKLLNNIKTRIDKVTGLISQEVETDDAVEVLLPSNQKLAADPPVDDKKTSKRGIKFKTKSTGKGYGAYQKPTKKYRIMLGSAMAGNNNKELLKTIKMNQL